MSAIGDSLKALREVLILHANVRRIEQDMANLMNDVSGLKDYAVALDKRLVRLETLVEVARASSTAANPRLSGS